MDVSVNAVYYSKWWEDVCIDDISFPILLPLCVVIKQFIGWFFERNKEKCSHTIYLFTLTHKSKVKSKAIPVTGLGGL
jgi:hypothetical protein